MAFQFATCDPDKALGFLKTIYPTQDVTTEKVSKLLDLVGKDILRVQDPNFHNRAQVVAGSHYSESLQAMINDAIEQLKTNVHSL